MNNYYNKKGEPIEMMKWAELFEDRDYKMVKQTKLKNKKLVSTIWLGLNHEFGKGEPLIFETMVFSKKEEFNELDCQRYSTLKEAEKGHEEMCKEWENK